MSIDLNGYGCLPLVVSWFPFDFVASRLAFPRRLNILTFSKFIRWGVDCRTILDGSKIGQIVAVSKLTPSWLQTVMSSVASSSSFAVNTPTQGNASVVPRDMM
jgi:hypothetical protein